MITMILSIIIFSVGGWFFGLNFPYPIILLSGKIVSLSGPFCMIGFFSGFPIGFIIATLLARFVPHQYVKAEINPLSPFPNIDNAYLIEDSNGDIRYFYKGKIGFAYRRKILSISVIKNVGADPHFEIFSPKGTSFWRLFALIPLGIGNKISFFVPEKEMFKKGEIKVITTVSYQLVPS
ncbi:MAG: hypothetical protein UT90_C0008G0011 [Parcubacteria group bacterium GW2011_GWA1_40_21]|nr:MAG: hypothetical protein UT90_C0008G0011 [Parcubacteria group bacterium GW2011_GWA1_40_21]